MGQDNIVILGLLGLLIAYPFLGILAGWVMTRHDARRPPQSLALPITFHSSPWRTIPPLLVPAPLLLVALHMVYTGIAGVAGFEDSFVERLPLTLAGLALAALSVLLLRFFGIPALWPDTLTISDHGISCRLRGQLRQWSWDEIADARVWNGGALLLLTLRHPYARRGWWDPYAARRLPDTVRLGTFWRASSWNVRGAIGIAGTIRAVMARRANAPVRTDPPLIYPATWR